MTSMQPNYPVMVGSLQVGGPETLYGAYNEFGGLKEYPIPKDGTEATVLHFFWEGREWFRKSVMRRPLPARSFFHSVTDPGMAELKALLEGGKF